MGMTTQTQAEQFRRISRFRPSHVSAMGSEPPRDQTPVNLSSVTATDIRERRDQSEQMLTDIIGERVVIRFAPEVGIEFTHDVHGLAGPAVHEIIDGEPCLAMVISQVYLDALIPVLFDSIAATPVLFDSVVLHEASHLVQYGPARKCRHTDHASVQHTAGSTADINPGKPKWFQHGVDFLRCMFHLRYRMKQRFHHTCLPLTFDHQFYGLSPAGEYRRAFGDAPRKLSHLPIREAIARPLPSEALDLWGRDVVASLSSSKKESA
jgi:hypothetical protein